MESHVFICYADPNGAEARAVCDALEEAGIRCWMAPRDITPGQTWSTARLAALTKTRLTVVVWSAQAVKDKGTQRLLEVMQSMKIAPLVCRLDDAAWPWMPHQSVHQLHQGALSADLPAIVLAVRQMQEAENRRTSSQGDGVRAGVVVGKGRPVGSEAAVGTDVPVEPPDKVEVGTALPSAATPPVGTTMSMPVVDRVTFSVTAPSRVAAGERFLLDVWAHFARDRDRVVELAQGTLHAGKVVIRSKGPIAVRRGTTLTAHLDVDDADVRQPDDTILWDGEIGNATFLVIIRAGSGAGPRSGTATIYADGLQIARVQFLVTVGSTAAAFPDDLGARHTFVHSAFASYAREDADEVLARVQGIKKAAPDLDIFLDVLSLRSGQDWARELQARIPRCDVFYLFWSNHARQSEWVEREWRCALATRGVDFIDPVPLVPPDEAPPPPELSAKHFDDWLLAFRRGRTRPNA